jgi:four helix bundle protein
VIADRSPVLADVNPLAALARAARGFGVDVGCAPGGWGLFRVQRNRKRECIVLRIYIVCIEIVREIRPYVERIARLDPDLARQLKKSSASVALNVSEGSGTRGGRRRNTYEIALGEARETRACLHVAEAAGYVPTVAPELLDKIDRVIATLVKVVR